MKVIPLFEILLLFFFVCLPAGGAEENPDSSETGMNAGESMIVNGLSKLIVILANGVLTGFSGAEAGQLNDSNYSGEQVAFFAVMSHSIDPSTNEGFQKDVDKTKVIYLYAAKFLAMVLTAFMMFQYVRPYEAAKAVGVVRGRPGFVTIDEMAEFYGIVCFWFLCCPVSFYSSLWLNNGVTQSLSLEALDHAVFSSENAGLYLILVLLWLIMAAFFAVRLVLIIIVPKVWIFLGLMLAIPKSRWLGIISGVYVMGFVFSQCIMVWTTVSVIVTSESEAMNWASSSLLYLGMFLVVIGEGLFVVFWPEILRRISPTSYYFMFDVARSV